MGVDSVLTLIVWILLLALLLFAVKLVINQMELPETVRIPLFLIVGILVLAWFLRAFGLM
jgi:hypothetical protein